MKFGIHQARRAGIRRSEVLNAQSFSKFKKLLAQDSYAKHKDQSEIRLSSHGSTACFDRLPSGEEWQYEPKWDGFRCIAFSRGRSKLNCAPKAGSHLTRYFPEVVDSLANLKAKNFVLDGELVISLGAEFSFDSLLQRIHPAESRVRKLSSETPATFIVFDLLATDDGKTIVDEHLSTRRQRLEKFAGKFLNKQKSIIPSPVAYSVDDANKWLSKTGVFLDGVIAKNLNLPYQSGNRKGMMKMKRMRTADCVVGGFRYGTGSDLVGSLLLGLYDDEGGLHHVGFTSSLSAKEKKELTAKLEKLKASKSFTEKYPRWSQSLEHGAKFRMGSSKGQAGS